MPEYRRARQAGGTYFFTANLFDRRSDLLTRRIEAFRVAVTKQRRQRAFVIDAAVVLPEHVHMIWTLPTGDGDFSARWRRIKDDLTRRGGDTSPRSASRRKRKERVVWQRRFYEPMIRDEADFRRHVDYIHYNPVKHGLVDRPVDWPYSSIHRHIARGILPATWGTSQPPADLDLE